MSTVAPTRTIDLKIGQTYQIFGEEHRYVGLLQTSTQHHFRTRLGLVSMPTGYVQALAEKGELESRGAT